eukprot:2257247-Pleurochrysis_carterae.AAC.1
MAFADLRTASGTPSPDETSWGFSSPTWAVRGRHACVVSAAYSAAAWQLSHYAQARLLKKVCSLALKWSANVYILHETLRRQIRLNTADLKAVAAVRQAVADARRCASS